MKKAPFMICMAMLFAAAAIADDPPAADMRHMTLSMLPLNQWLTDSVTVERGDPQSLTLTLHDKPFGSALPQIRYAVTPQARITAQVKQIHGRLAVQCEWFDAKGQFLGATNGPELTKAQALSINVPDLLATSDYKDSVHSFGVKLWLGGDDASATLADFQMTTAITWKHTGVKRVHEYRASAPIEKDRGMQVDTLENVGWALRLQQGAAVGAFVLSDRVSYNTHGIVLFDLAMIDQGDVTIQALCWDKDGNYVSSVNLLQSATTAGLYELPLSLYADQFPAQTQQLSFKIWMGGKKPSAIVEQVLYGIDGE